MSCKPKIAVISTTFMSTAREICDVAASIRELSPETVIIAGGTKILKSYKKYLLFGQKYFEGFDMDRMRSLNFFFDADIDRHIDLFIIEECGEVTLLELIRRIQEGLAPHTVPNLAYRENGELIFTHQKKEPNTFNSYLIDWERVDPRMVGTFIPVRAGSGCPHRCGFCDFTTLHSKVCLKSIDNLMEELRLITRAFPGKKIFFTDDNLFINSRRTTEICSAIIRNGVDMRWKGFLRADSVTRENIELIAESGCDTAYLGIESGDDQILENMNKKERRCDAVRAVNLLNQHSISTLLTLMIGFPGETTASVDNTISLLNSFGAGHSFINRYFPFEFILAPLSPVASPENRSRFGISGGYNTWTHATMDSEEAKKQYRRLFNSVTGCSLGYYEADLLPPNCYHELGCARDELVKSGTGTLDNNTVAQVYDTFRNILGSGHEESIPIGRRCAA